MKPKLVLFIVGPTASGKSELAIALAKRLKGEVISADSMLVYKGMDIGTAKLLKKERRGILHHGIDLISPSENFSVFAYRRFALKAIKEVIRREKIPIVAGGTGFYVRSLLEGLSPQPGADAKVRRKLELEARDKGLPALYARLMKIDPERARQIGPHNQRRIIRALEIYQLSGKKPSQSSRKSPGLNELGYETLVIGINRDRPSLYQKINKRVDQMFRKGLVREVKRLARKKISQTALQGVGYKEVLEWQRCHCERSVRHNASGGSVLWRKAISKTGSPRRLNEAPRDDMRLSEVKEKIKQTTRHFAKRQWTWFKREKGIRWVWWPEKVSVQTVGSFIIDHFYLQVNQPHNLAVRHES